MSSTTTPTTEQSKDYISIPDDLSKHTIAQLKALLVSRNESIVGSKETLTKRLNSLRELELLANDNEIVPDEEIEPDVTDENINEDTHENGNGNGNGTMVEMEHEEVGNNDIEDEEKIKKLEEIEGTIYNDEDDQSDGEPNVNNEENEMDEQAIMDQLLGTQQPYSDTDYPTTNDNKKPEEQPTTTSPNISTTDSNGTNDVYIKKESNTNNTTNSTTTTTSPNNNNNNNNNNKPIKPTIINGKSVIKHKEIDKNKLIADLRDMDESFKKKPLLKITGLNDTINEKEIKEHLSTTSPVHGVTYEGTAKKDTVIVLADSPQLIIEKMNQSKLKTQTLTISEIPATDSLLFVGNLGSEIDKNQIRKMFDKFGELDRVILIRNRVLGDSKGYGFVDFRSKTAANNARSSLNNSSLNRKNIRVDWAENCSTLELMHSKTILVDKLPRFLVDLAKLKTVFGTFGKIKDINVIPHPRGGNAFIDYENVEDAEKAQILMNDKEVQGYKIRVSFGNPSKPGHTNLQKTQQNNQHHRNRQQQQHQHQHHQHHHHHHPYQQNQHHPHHQVPQNHQMLMPTQPQIPQQNNKQYRGGYRNQGGNQHQNPHMNPNVPPTTTTPNIYTHHPHPSSVPYQSIPPTAYGQPIPVSHQPFEHQPPHHPPQPNRPTSNTTTPTSNSVPTASTPGYYPSNVPNQPYTATSTIHQPNVAQQQQQQQQLILSQQQSQLLYKQQQTIQMMEMKLKQQQDQLVKATSQSQKDKAMLKQQQIRMKQHQQIKPPTQPPQQPVNNYYYKNPAAVTNQTSTVASTTITPTATNTPTAATAAAGGANSQNYPANWQQYYAQYYAQNPEAYWQYYQNYAGYNQHDLSAYYANYMQGQVDPNAGQKHTYGTNTNQSHHDNSSKRGRQH